MGKGTRLSFAAHPVHNRVVVNMTKAYKQVYTSVGVDFRGKLLVREETAWVYLKSGLHKEMGLWNASMPSKYHYYVSTDQAKQNEASILEEVTSSLVFVH